jgi:hypothetical protein
MVALAIGAAAAVGAGASLYGSSQASGAAKDASNLQLDMYRQTRGDLSGYNMTGQNALGSALALAQSGPNGGGPDYLSQAAGMVPGRMTQAELEQTPGYQFDLSQGLKATQAAAAARGLGVSGASLKGAATYATGLANKTYLDQFGVSQKRFEDVLNLNQGQQGNLTNQFNRLGTIATLGENAAAQTGTQGTAGANSAGGFLNQSGQAQAAGTTGVQNALTGGANSYLANQNFNTLMNRYGSTTGGYGTNASTFGQAGGAAQFDVPANTFGSY